jgi:transposase
MVPGGRHFRRGCMRKYVVTLTAEERQRLSELVTSGKSAAKRLAHARILLKADAAPGGPAWTDDRIAEAVEVSTDTVGRVRRRFVEQGLETALARKPQDRPSRERKLDGRAEARLIALACSAPPHGRKEWTLKLLADKLVELEIVEAVSDETVRRVLKKTSSSPGRRSSGASRRRPAPSSSARWKTCWRSTTGPTTPSGPWSAWTRRVSSWSAK